MTSFCAIDQPSFFHGWKWWFPSVFFHGNIFDFVDSNWNCTIFINGMFPSGFSGWWLKITRILHLVPTKGNSLEKHVLKSKSLLAQWNLIDTRLIFPPSKLYLPPVRGMEIHQGALHQNTIHGQRGKNTLTLPPIIMIQWKWIYLQ